MASTGVAPVCNAKAEQPAFISKVPPIPRFAVPNAANPESMVKAIQQLQQALNHLTDSSPPPNNTVPGVIINNFGGNGGGGGVAGGGGGKQKTPQPQQWEETARVTQNVKVVNPDDDSQFVIVKEIVSITFERSDTGEKIVIRRDP